MWLAIAFAAVLPGGMLRVKGNRAPPAASPRQVARTNNAINTPLIANQLASPRGDLFMSPAHMLNPAYIYHRHVPQSIKLNRTIDDSALAPDNAFNTYGGYLLLCNLYLYYCVDLK